MWESAILATICVADLVTTLWLVAHQGAEEANPMMRFFLDRGTLPFVAAKGALVLAPLAVLEWARRRHPRFVHGMARLSIALYLGLYGVVLLRTSANADYERLTPAQYATIERYCAGPVTNADLAALYRLNHAFPRAETRGPAVALIQDARNAHALTETLNWIATVGRGPLPLLRAQPLVRRVLPYGAGSIGQ